MRTFRVLLVVFACGALLGACSKEKKTEAEKADQAGETKATGDTATAAPKAAEPAKPIGNKLAGLLGGGNAGEGKGGILGGIGLAEAGEHIGDIGAGAVPAEATGEGATPPAMPTSTTAPGAAAPAVPATNAPPAAAGSGQCEAVAVHLMQIMKKEVAANMAAVPPELAAELEKQLASAKQQIVAECQRSNWPPAVHKCLLAATDMTSLTKCESLVTGGAAAAAGGAGDVGMGDVPAEVQSSGDAECDKVAEHVFDVMIGAASAEEREMAAAMKPMMLTELSKQCASTPWPKAARACILKASSETAMEQCATKHGLE